MGVRVQGGCCVLGHLVYSRHCGLLPCTWYAQRAVLLPAYHALGRSLQNVRLGCGPFGSRLHNRPPLRGRKTQFGHTQFGQRTRKTASSTHRLCAPCSISPRLLRQGAVCCVPLSNLEGALEFNAQGHKPPHLNYCGRHLNPAIFQLTQ